MSADRAAARGAFAAQSGWDDATSTALAGDASARRYFRLTRQKGGGSAVLMDASPDLGQDTVPFVRLAQHLRSLGFSAPAILAADNAQGFLLLEDLGDALFTGAIAADPACENRLYSAAIDLLAALGQTPPPPGLTALTPLLAGQMVAPACDWYALGMAGHAASADDLCGTLTGFAADLIEDGPQVLMLRDYHAENLIWLPGRAGVAQVGLLDFQDAMLAHPAYDLISILQDARRDVSPALAQAMTDRFIAASGADPSRFAAAAALLGAQRQLRILGIFSRLAMQAGKPQYAALIPRVWAHLQTNLAHPALAGLARVTATTLPAPTPEGLTRITLWPATPKL